ncbi:helix-turn-helix transcriptional regulator [Acidimangrovimonas pyrenivorans]|uniref:Helix-turn-helix transcriptional regulator n=1 Tax=Acidimangrovimonas pyrenivorans TaxID=2030798 RepID=A0ABV7ACW1_9RHOB
MNDPLENHDPNVLLSSKKLAGVIGVSAVTLSRWRSEGKGPAYIRFGPTRVAYSVRAIRDWLAERTVE